MDLVQPSVADNGYPDRRDGEAQRLAQVDLVLDQQLKIDAVHFKTSACPQNGAFTQCARFGGLPDGLFNFALGSHAEGFQELAEIRIEACFIELMHGVCLSFQDAAWSRLRRRVAATPRACQPRCAARRRRLATCLSEHRIPDYSRIPYTRCRGCRHVDTASTGQTIRL